MNIQFDTSELDPIVDLLAKRAETMISEAIAEGKARAADVALRGYKRGVTTGYLRKNRRTLRREVRTVTGKLQANWCERMMYRRLVDFYGSW